jgi:hypothetical protein
MATFFGLAELEASVASSSSVGKLGGSMLVLLSVLTFGFI